MLRILAVLLAVFVTTAAAGALQPPIEIKVTAENLGKEFEGNTDAAVKKYLPPKEGAGGALITLTGVVIDVDAKNKEVGLRAGPNSRIVLHAKNLEGVQTGDMVKAEKARFRTYFKRIILIDCDAVKPAKP